MLRYKSYSIYNRSVLQMLRNTNRSVLQLLRNTKKRRTTIFTQCKYVSYYKSYAKWAQDTQQKHKMNKKDAQNVHKLPKILAETVRWTTR